MVAVIVRAEPVQLGPDQGEVSHRALDEGGGFRHHSAHLTCCNMAPGPRALLLRTQDLTVTDATNKPSQPHTEIFAKRTFRL